MSREKRNFYEAMYIVDPALGDLGREAVLDRIRQGIESRGGVILRKSEWGKKRLAYVMQRFQKKYRDGYYVVFYFSLETRHTNQLWKDYKVDEDILRFLMIETTEERIPNNEEAEVG